MSFANTPDPGDDVPLAEIVAGGDSEDNQVAVAEVVETPVMATEIPTDIVLADVATPPPPHTSLVRRCFSGLEWLFGAACLIVILAVLATVPILQFVSLGYLVEVAGRVARTGRLRAGLVGFRKAARVGSLIAGTWLWLLPLRFLADLWRDAQLIEPGGRMATNLKTALIVATALVVSHVVWAWFRGGRFRHFLWPAPLRFVRRLRSGGMLTQARDVVWDFVVDLRLPYLFWLGLRAFAGALIWLIVPVTLLASASRIGNGLGVLAGLFGGLLLATLLLYLPFLQTRFAVENRFQAMFEVRPIRRLFRRAPIAFWFALLVTLLFALPLYLLKIELTPREVAWLPSLVFVLFIFPARLLTGWAMGRALHRHEPRHFLFRWSARFAAIPIVGIYTLIVYATQYLSWYGVYSLYEQHAFLVPVPFLGM